MHLFRLVFLLAYSSMVSGQILLQDKFIFKVSNEIFSLKDIQRNHQGLKQLKCVYPESLTYAIFINEVKRARQEFFEFSQDFSQKQIEYFKSLMSFYKLYVFSENSDVKVNQSLIKYLKIAAKENGCDKKVFNGEDFNPSFFKLIKLEVFVRSRFLATEKNSQGNTTNSQKAIVAVRNLIASINEQIESEVFW